ncbi:uncharacterized protein FIBRA_05844 [Fibroporia radiculosa]|uniref:B30.2/SPRY domain-containing protein n=1 Tax=Fibroporia radiculosa TaxID=599839 RepID=J4GA74_9APHY|nr:uncharacterized protein FIBRA_05844 [Fibroporia radiculosa]CCM03698.1 predicted protein [Fibroporia radiculosa]
MEAPNSPREPSPPVLVITPVNPPQNRKRKHTAISNTVASSPAPSDPGATPTAVPENIVLPTRHLDLISRPRLTISRHPSFVPIHPGSPYYTTEPLCNNRLNFRYTPAGLASEGCTLPFRTIESAPTCFRVSWEDRSTFIKVTQDGLGLKGEKGFRSARCNAPIREGKWYMEVKIELGGGERDPESKSLEGSHVRLGWARREAPLNGPAGLDGYSYAYRDKTGEKVNLSRLRPYGQPFRSGDVIGMYISLPSPRRKPDKKDPHDPAHFKRERIAIDFKGQEYFESLEYPQSKEMIALMGASDRAKATNSGSMPSSATKKSATVKNLPLTARGNKDSVREPASLRPLPTLGADSHIAFFVNGACQGVAFQDLFDYLPLRAARNKAQEKKRANKEGLREHRENACDDGTLGYYPFISLFNGARVRINPGPNFDFPPPPDVDALLAGADDAAADVKPPPPQAPRTWRPMCERYQEFIAEQKALDEREEAEANGTRQARPPPAAHAPPAASDSARKTTELDPDEERAKLEAHRAKRRAQAAARRERKARAALEEAEAKRRKLAEEETARGASMDVDDGARFGLSAVAPDVPLLELPQEYDERAADSPAPTVDARPVTPHHDSSAYNSEYDVDDEKDTGAQDGPDDVGDNDMDMDDRGELGVGNGVYMYEKREDITQ